MRLLAPDRSCGGRLRLVVERILTKAPPTSDGSDDAMAR
jgi:hypothetical protein